MRKLDLILENIRDEYMINLLEEGETTELETLKTKKFLNENLNRIRKMMIEEGALEGVKQHLGDNWGKYLAGAAGAGAGAMGVDALEDMGADARMGGSGDGAFIDNVASGAEQAVDSAQAAGQGAMEGMQQFGDHLVDQAGNIYDQTGQLLGNVKNSAEAAAGMDNDVRGGAQAPMGLYQP